MSICPIEKLIQFDLLDDCIHTPAGYYHFYRYYPPNTDIMTEEEKKAEIEQMTQLFDTLAREIAIFATDKIEDMSEIKRFYKNLAPEYDHLTSDIIAAIESTESRNSAAVQRAFYFIIRTDKQEESVYNQIAGKGYHINKAQREELAVLLRNYYLREFISAEIYTLEKELKQDVKLRKKIEKKPELFQKELQRRLLPHSMEFFPSFAVQNGTYRSTMMLKNFPFEIGSCCLLQTACMRGTSFMMRLTPMNGREIKKLTEKQMNMINFSLLELLEGSKDRTQAVLFNLATWIWSQIALRRWKILFNMDELYLFLENQFMVRWICSCVKRVRKYQALVGVATQQLADCLRPDIATYTTALFNNSAYKFLFYPGEIDLPKVKDQLDLKAGEIEKIRNPNQKHCLVKAGDDKYYIQVGSLPYENELFGKAGG